MEIKEFQKLIKDIYFEKDRRRGTEGTFMWLCEEVGELSRAIKKKDVNNLNEEFADVLAWTFSLANLLDIDLEKAVRKYENGCPKCGKIPCECDNT